MVRGGGLEENPDYVHTLVQEFLLQNLQSKEREESPNDLYNCKQVKKQERIDNNKKCSRVLSNLATLNRVWLLYTIKSYI